MKLPKAISKEGILNGLKSLGKLRIKISHTSILTFSALLLIMFLAFTVRMLPLRWEIETGAMHLSEFDPFYQYSLTKYMVDHGLLSPYWPSQWIDYQRWYPEGINMGVSLSSLPMTTAIFYDMIKAFGVNIDLMSFCAVVAPAMGALACLILYFLGKDIGGRAVGMFAALFLALNGSFIQRTALGFFDTETVGVVSLLLFSLLFLRAIEEERSIKSAMGYSIGSAAALAYFVLGWGAAYYLIGLTVLFVFVLVLLKRNTRRLLMVYSVTFGLGLLMSISNPYISTAYLTSFAVLPVAGVFALLCLGEIIRNLTSARGKILFVIVFLAAIVGGFTVLWMSGRMEVIAEKFSTILDPFLRSDSPLVESVAEHRISAWGSVYYDLGIVILFFGIGLFFVARNLNNRNLFLLLFGLTSLYFASSMVRLLVIFAPAFGLLAGVGIVGILRPFITLLREPPKLTVKKKFGLEHVGKEYSGIAVFMIFLILMTSFAISPQSGGIPKVFRQAYAPVTITAGSLPIVPNTPVREWMDMLEWMNSNLGSTTVVDSWWDYGYWLSLMGNVTSLADNATINTTQIENVGFTFMANEMQSLQMLKQYNAKYILVFTTIALRSSTSTGEIYASWAGYGDEGKWMWMAKISGKAKQRFIDTPYLNMTEETSWINETKFGNFANNTWVWNEFGMNSTIYKLMSNGKSRWCTVNGVPDADAANVTIPQFFEEAYFAGLTLTAEEAASRYGGLIPLVCLYRINYPD
jgi:dolichyl-diphosphooligosaccharide--protein glycosyltransferase